MSRPKGSKDKATKELRLVIAGLVDANSDKFQGWLDSIEKDCGPLEAFKRIESLLEFCIPKLARAEIQPLGADGKPSDGISKIIIEHVAPKK